MGRMPASIPLGRVHREPVPAHQLATTPTTTNPRPMTSTTTRLPLLVICQHWPRSVSRTAQASGERGGAAQISAAQACDVAPTAATATLPNLGNTMSNPSVCGTYQVASAVSERRLDSKKRTRSYCCSCDQDSNCHDIHQKTRLTIKLTLTKTRLGRRTEDRTEMTM